MSTRTRISWVARLLLAPALIAIAGCAADPPGAVVGLTVTGCPPGQAHGSGVLVEPGLVLTSAHVVKGAERIDVTNGSRDATGTVVAFDPNMDLAYIRVEPALTPSMSLGAGLPARGAEGTAYVFRDGEPVTLPVRVRRPVNIETEDIYIEGDTTRPGLELDAAIKAGDSGGPVVIGGRVVGVLWARSDKHAGRAYAIDPARAGDLIREQLTNGIDDSIELDRCS